jgi:hypothetical protein
MRVNELLCAEIGHTPHQAIDSKVGFNKIKLSHLVKYLDITSYDRIP